MAIIYATLIIKGRKTFAQVPAVIKEDVRQVLIDLDCEALAVEQFSGRQIETFQRLFLLSVKEENEKSYIDFWESK